jgi:hypothetical protein
MTDAGAAVLAGMISDLDGHIGRRAAELTAPLIEEARAGAAAAAASARSDVQRKDDLVAELRRRIDFLERERGQWREVTGARFPAEARRTRRSYR